MEFVITLTDERQIELETVGATVTDDGDVEFSITGTITDVGAGTLEPIQGADVRPVSVTFETVNQGTG